jgi:hypothetical protein
MMWKPRVVAICARAGTTCPATCATATACAAPKRIGSHHSPHALAPVRHPGYVREAPAASRAAGPVALIAESIPSRVQACSAAMVALVES